MVRTFWTVLGLLSLGAGLIGAVLPILPTTPFIILAAAAFGKGSPRLQAMLENHRTFGPMILDWRTNGAIAPRYKAMAVTMMGAVFCYSLFIGLDVRILLIQGLCLGGAATFILSRPNGAPKGAKPIVPTTPERQ